MNMLITVVAFLVMIHIALTWWQAVRGGRQRRADKLDRRHDNRVMSQHQPGETTPPVSVWPSASIIVPAWREGGTIERCIGSLLSLDYPDWEAIVVAGGPDRTYEAAIEAVGVDPRFQVLMQPPRGKNAALNAGLRAAKGEVIVMLDADSRVRPDWLRAIIQPLTQEIAAATGFYAADRNTAITRCELLERIIAYEIRGGVALHGSGGIAVRREVMEQVGPFPEDVLVGVDRDLDLRMVEHDLPRAYVREAVVSTQRPSTLAEFWRNETRWRRGHLWLIRYWKAYTPANLIFYAVAALALLTIPALLAALVNGWIGLAALCVLFWVWMLARRGAAAAQVAAYTGESRWLSSAVPLAGLLVVSIVAAWAAVITPGQRSAHFKGPRRQEAADGVQSIHD
jgi:cellulose synthase/poly-beta-1,6-N-acetylglucosamine synthase-like glycosyltransferase